MPYTLYAPILYMPYTLHTPILYMPLYFTCPYTLHAPILYMPLYFTCPYTIYTPILYMPLYSTCPYTLHTPILYMPLYSTYPYILHAPILYMPYNLHAPKLYMPLYSTCPYTLHGAFELKRNMIPLTEGHFKKLRIKKMKTFNYIHQPVRRTILYRLVVHHGLVVGFTTLPHVDLIGVVLISVLANLARTISFVQHFGLIVWTSVPPVMVRGKWLHFT